VPVGLMIYRNQDTGFTDIGQTSGPGLTDRNV
jgi:hypothetical protein